MADEHASHDDDCFVRNYCNLSHKPSGCQANLVDGTCCKLHFGLREKLERWVEIVEAHLILTKEKKVIINT